MIKTSPFEIDVIEISNKVLKEVVGRKIETQSILSAMISGKHILIEGPPGTSKSTLLRTIAKETGMPLYMVEGNVDLTPAKVVGHFNPAGVLKDSYRKEHFEKGPLSKAMEEGGILYIEEFNRIPADVSNVLISPMEEREIFIPRYGSIKALPSFTIIAAQNPYDDVGTVRVSKAFMDRVCLIKMEYQDKKEEQEIVKRRTNVDHPRIVALAVDLIHQTRDHFEIKVGSSVRGAIDFVDLLTGFQKMNDGDKGNLILAACMALSNKIWLKEMTEKNADEIIKEILNSLRDKYPELLDKKDNPASDYLRTEINQGEDIPDTEASKKKIVL